MTGVSAVGLLPYPYREGALLHMNRPILQSVSPPTAEAIADIIGALRQFSNCFYLAATSVKLRYKRSLLGPLWITITTAIFIFFISYLYTGFIRADFRHYLLNLALGWIIWHFIADLSCKETDLSG